MCRFNPSPPLGVPCVRPPSQHETTGVWLWKSLHNYRTSIHSQNCGKSCKFTVLSKHYALHFSLCLLQSWRVKHQSAIVFACWCTLVCSVKYTQYNNLQNNTSVSFLTLKSWVDRLYALWNGSSPLLSMNPFTTVGCDKELYCNPCLYLALGSWRLCHAASLWNACTSLKRPQSNGLFSFELLFGDVGWSHP